MKINRNLLVYLVSVVLATIFWFLNKTGSYIDPTIEFRVEYSGIPGDKILLPGVTTSSLKVDVSVKGSVLLTTGTFQDFIRIDLSKLTLRNVPHADSTLKYISGDDIRQQIEAQLPTDFKFLKVQPDTIFLDFGRSVTKKVPVILDADISFDAQYRAADGIILQPDSVEISTSAIIADSVTCVKTEYLELLNLQEPVQRHVQFIIPNEVTCHTLYTDLKINTEKFTEQTLVLPIRQINTPDSILMRVFPQSATVKFFVGWANYQRISKDMFSIAVDYADLNSPLKSDLLSIKLIRSPEKLGVTDIRISPSSVEYLVERNVNFSSELP
ncbi:MAG: hypothetical protein J6Y24_12330 [Bacteroidales bacterium]|nr:hypothetical protein [Bacteroidales bacterium]MBP5503565.1 hypothetical protein [Bacteroidales bacterium]